MSIRRSRRLAGLEPVVNKDTLVKKEPILMASSPVPAPNIMRIISQYLFFLVWTTFLLRKVLLR